MHAFDVHKMLLLAGLGDGSAMPLSPSEESSKAWRSYDTLCYALNCINVFLIQVTSFDDRKLNIPSAEQLPFAEDPSISRRYAYYIRRQGSSIRSSRSGVRRQTQCLAASNSTLLLTGSFISYTTEEFDELCFDFGMQMVNRICWHG